MPTPLFQMRSTTWRPARQPSPCPGRGPGPRHRPSEPNVRSSAKESRFGGPLNLSQLPGCPQEGERLSERGEPPLRPCRCALRDGPIRAVSCRLGPRVQRIEHRCLNRPAAKVGRRSGTGISGRARFCPTSPQLLRRGSRWHAQRRRGTTSGRPAASTPPVSATSKTGPHRETQGGSRCWSGRSPPPEGDGAARRRAADEETVNRRRRGFSCNADGPSSRLRPSGARLQEEARPMRACGARCAPTPRLRGD
jgi:hypothetical protein